MIYSNQGKFSFYAFLASFDSTEGKQKHYMNDKVQYEVMVKEFSYRFSNLYFSDVVPTQEQQDRLEVLNSIQAENKESWGDELTTFVQYGAILDSFNSQFLLDIKADYTETTERYLANQGMEPVNAKIEALWNAADKYISGYISGVAIGILSIGVMQQKPKALAVTGWSSAIWAEYYARKALVTAASTDDHDFTAFGAIPFSIPELQAEIGL